MLDFGFIVVLLFNSTVEISYASLQRCSSYRCNDLYCIKTWYLCPALYDLLATELVASSWMKLLRAPDRKALPITTLSKCSCSAEISSRISVRRWESIYFIKIANYTWKLTRWWGWKSKQWIANATSNDESLLRAICRKTRFVKSVFHWANSLVWKAKLWIFCLVLTLAQHH